MVVRLSRARENGVVHHAARGLEEQPAGDRGAATDQYLLGSNVLIASAIAIPTRSPQTLTIRAATGSPPRAACAASRPSITLCGSRCPRVTPGGQTGERVAGRHELEGARRREARGRRHRGVLGQLEPGGAVTYTCLQ